MRADASGLAVVTRWLAAGAGLALAGGGLATAWMVWVINQGTNQELQPGWPAFRYAAPLLGALVLSVAAWVSVMAAPTPVGRARVAVGVVAGLESLLFGVVWAGLVADMPFPA